MNLRTALLTAAVLGISSHTFAVAPKINFSTDSVAPPANANPLNLTGTTAGVGWTLNAQGTDLFTKPTPSGTDVYYIHNTATAGKTRGATFELILSKPIYGLTFQVQDFGTRSINYGASNSNVSGGEQTYTVAAFNGANPTDLAVSNGVAESLIQLADLGTSLKATSGVFDAQGTNIAGFERTVTYTLGGPTTRIFIETHDQSLTTNILGDNVSLSNVTWPEVQVPEPTTLAALAFAGTMLRRSRKAK